jgi:hypothetical protein
MASIQSTLQDVDIEDIGGTMPKQASNSNGRAKGKKSAVGQQPQSGSPLGPPEMGESKAMKQTLCWS